MGASAAFGHLCHNRITYCFGRSEGCVGNAGSILIPVSNLWSGLPGLGLVIFELIVVHFMHASCLLKRLLANIMF